MSSLKFDEPTIRAWSKLGPRATYGVAMLDLVATNPRVIVLSADLGNSSGLDRLRKQFPDSYIDAGIAEQNMVGVAAGLAKEGFTAFVSSFAPFVSMRACEQLRMNLGYMELDVKAVAIGSGLSMNFLGNSHFGLEDVSIVRSIPNIQIVSPSDCQEVVRAVQAISKSKVPTYLRLTGIPSMPIVNDVNYTFTLGKFIEYSQGSDVTIIATGSMVSVAIQVAELLRKKGVDVGVVNCHTIRPIDEDYLIRVCSRTQYLITIEEHFVNGGLGTAILESLNEKKISKPTLRIGIPNRFSKTGSYQYMMDLLELGQTMILEKILIFIEGQH